MEDELRQLTKRARTSGMPCEALGIRTAETVMEYGSNRLDTIRESEGLTLCLRVRKGGRTGVVTTTRLTDVEQAWLAAVAMAEIGPVSHDSLAAEADDAAAVRTEMVPQGRLSGRTAAAATATQGFIDQIYELSGLTVHATARLIHDHVCLQRTTGFDSSYERDVFHLAMVMESSDASFQVTSSHWLREAPQLSPHLREWIQLAAQWADLPERHLPAGKYDVLFAPPAVYALLTPIVGGLSGKAVLSGQSLVGQRVGTRLLHHAITIADAGGASAPLWVPFDDEGVATRPIALVANGVPAGLYHSRATAAATGEQPTGHGFRGTAFRKELLQAASPALGNVRMEPGATALPELIRSMRRGILVESLLGYNQSRSLATSVGGHVRLGLIVENGEVVARMAGQSCVFDVLEVLGPAFACCSTESWAVGRTWFGQLPFVLSTGITIQ